MINGGNTFFAWRVHILQKLLLHFVNASRPFYSSPFGWSAEGKNDARKLSTPTTTTKKSTSRSFSLKRYLEVLFPLFVHPLRVKYQACVFVGQCLCSFHKISAHVWVGGWKHNIFIEFMWRHHFKDCLSLCHNR